jgi:branched-chain amino acid transport system substrate-binding protein
MRKAFVILLTLAFIFGLAVDEAASAGKTEKAEGPIKIGNIQDLTGGASSAGQPNAWGAEYAIRVINEAGGINGRMIEITTLDCKNDAGEGVNAYRKLVDEVGVVAIIGPPLSNPAAAWVELSAEDKVPIVGHFMDEMCTTDPETGEVYPYMFLVQPSCSIQSYCIAKFAMTTLGVRSVATLYNPGNAFAKAHAAPLVDYFKAHGGSVVAEETFTWTDGDYSAQALKISRLNPDAVFLCDYAAQVTRAYDALRDAGYKGKILGANTLSLPFPSLVKNKVYDTYFLQNYDLLNKNLGNIYELTRKHMVETRTNDPKANVGFGWDAVQVLAAAMRKAKDPTNGEELRDLLAQTKDVLLSGGITVTINPATNRPTNVGMFIADYDEKAQLRILSMVYAD